MVLKSANARGLNYQGMRSDFEPIDPHMSASAPESQSEGAKNQTLGCFLVLIRPAMLKRRHFGVLGPSRLFEGLLCDMIFPNVSIVSVTVCMVA